MADDETLDSSTSASGAGRLNAAAPEFNPRGACAAASPARHHHRRGGAPHHHHHHHPTHGSHAAREGEDEHAAAAEAAAAAAPASAREGLPEDVVRRVTKQVEFYFSDVNLATTEHLMRFISKDPEGYVPISVVASFKKIRELVHDKSLLAAALRTSSELVVSDDGKKVRRLQSFTEADVEKVQSRIVVAENLPEDHRYINLMKIFSAVGSVKTIRTCYPDGAGPAVNRSSRIEMLFANKLHAFVEYETVEDAEKAIAELSGGRNWRSELRVRLLLGCLKHAPGRGRKVGDESEEGGDEDDLGTTSQPKDNETVDPSQSSEAHFEHQAEENFNDKGGAKHGRGRGRGGRGRGRGQYNSHNRDGGHTIGTPPSSHAIHAEQPAVVKQPPGPRMPDGTRGFTMGRGKPSNPINTD